MATPRRSLLLSDIGTTLATITTGNGYKTTVSTVEAVGKDWADVKPGQKPWIGYVPTAESLEYLPGGVIRSTLPVTLVCHVSGTTQSDRATKLNDLLDDVIAVLAVDTTRDSNAISTTIKTVETDEGSPDAIGDGSMVVVLQIAYHRTTAQS